MSIDTPPQSLLIRRSDRALVLIDLAESVRHIERDEEDTVRRWQALVMLCEGQLLPTHQGRLVKSTGDGLLLEFEGARSAIRCAIALQEAMAAGNQSRPSDEWLFLRIGAHVADLISDQHDVYGRGVNLVARIATAARPGDIVVSAEVRARLVDGLDADIEDMGETTFEDMGDNFLRHVSKPVRLYRLGALPALASWSPITPVNPLRPSIVVIPFDVHNVSGTEEWLGEAMADELISALSLNHGLTVISRLSSRVFRGRIDALQGIATHLHADYVLAGSIHVHAAHLRILAQLTEVRSGNVVAAHSAQGSAHGVLAGQESTVDDLVVKTCDALQRRQIERVRAEPMSTLESYCLLMAAIGFLHSTSKADFDRAREMLEHLAQRDRRHPAPHAWLAKWHVIAVQQGWGQDRRTEAQLAVDCTQKALDLDPRSSLSLAIDGFVHCNLLKQLDAAESRYEMAIAENPNESLAWLFLGTVHAFRGEGVEALTSSERALELSPLDPMRYFYESLTATAALAAGQYERTIAHAKRSLKMHRTHMSTLRAMTIAQVQLGRMDEARATAKQLMALDKTLTITEYRDRSPSSGFPTGKLWCEALEAAGVPAQ